MIVAIQGTAAIGALLPGRLQHGQNSLSAIFLPLAFIGLLRLPTAYWLTDDFHIIHMFEKTYDQSLQGSMTTHTLIPLLRMHSAGSSNPPLLSQADVESIPRYRPRLFAFAAGAVYALFAFFSLGVALYQLIWPINEGQAFSLAQI